MTTTTLNDNSNDPNISDEELNIFVDALIHLSKYDFSEYSEKSLKRRIEKISNDQKINLIQLIDRMHNGSISIEDIVKSITVNTTELFRDTPMWLSLKDGILPQLAKQDNINIWHAGCSSGQEVFSMIILLDELNLLEKTKIFATDINYDILEQAQKGVFKLSFNQFYVENFNKVLNDDPQKIQVSFEKYFDIDKTKDLIKAKPILTQKPQFVQHDLVKDGNVFNTKFDIIMCRNVLIYFNSSLQNKVFQLFYDSLESNRFLIIGIHESMLGPLQPKFDKDKQTYKKRPY